jgi:chromosome segregation protein
VLLSEISRLSGEHAVALRDAIGEAVIVETFEQARMLATALPVPVATVEGDVLRGSHLVTGGGKVESRGILATKREIKELRERVSAEREALERLAAETAAFELTIAQAGAAVGAFSSELHRQEKAIVSVEAQLNRASDDVTRLLQRAELVAAEAGRTREEIAELDARQTEARESIARLDEQRVVAETVLAETQRTLTSARDHADAMGQRAAEARATHAALVERASAVAADVLRLEDAARDLERRLETCASDLTLMREQRERLIAAAADGTKLVDDLVRALENLRADMIQADEAALSLKASTEQQEDTIRDHRRALDSVRALAAELDIMRATAEAELTHLSQQCLDAVNLPLEVVRAEVERMEAEGHIEPDAAAIRAAEVPDPDEEDEEPGGVKPVSVAESEPLSSGPMTAEQAITELKGKIDKLGPVNMMAIEQFS